MCVCVCVCMCMCLCVFVCLFVCLFVVIGIEDESAQLVNNIQRKDQKVWRDVLEQFKKEEQHDLSASAKMSAFVSAVLGILLQQT